MTVMMTMNLSIGKANNSSNDGNNNRINSNDHVQKKELLQSSGAKGNGNVVLCNQMAFIHAQMNATKKKRNDEALKSYVYEQTIMELEVRVTSLC